jgi:hypothetical protein
MSAFLNFTVNKDSMLNTIHISRETAMRPSKSGYFLTAKTLSSKQKIAISLPTMP